MSNFFFSVGNEFSCSKKTSYSVSDFWWTELVPQCSLIVAEIGAADIFIFINTTGF